MLLKQSVVDPLMAFASLALDLPDPNVINYLATVVEHPGDDPTTGAYIRG